MIAKYEKRFFQNNAKAWAGTYYGLKNMVHWHNEVELIYVKHGFTTIGINSKTYKAKKGDAFLCESGDIHFINSPEDCVLLIIIFDPKLIKSINYSLNSPQLKRISNFECIYNKIEKELSEQKAFYIDKINSYILDVITDIFRNEEGKIKPIKGANHMYLLYQSMLRHIDNSFADINFETAAQFMGYTPSHFSKIFINFSGMSFTNYLNTIRIEKALELIKNSDMTITNIATHCGFNSVRHFNRVFKSLTGITPTQIKKDFSCTTPFIKTYNETFNPTISYELLIEKTVEGK